MTLPRAIERYYTRKLFRLIQAELAKRDIAIETVEQLQGMMIGMIHMVQIGSITTMFLKEEKLCTYSEPIATTHGLRFDFNGEIRLVNVSQWLIALGPMLIVKDAIMRKFWNVWYTLKCKLLYK